MSYQVISLGQIKSHSINLTDEKQENNKKIVLKTKNYLILPPK